MRQVYRTNWCCKTYDLYIYRNWENFFTYLHSVKFLYPGVRTGVMIWPFFVQVKAHGSCLYSSSIPDDTSTLQTMFFVIISGQINFGMKSNESDFLMLVFCVLFSVF
jgi:hypothetical protein